MATGRDFAFLSLARERGLLSPADAARLAGSAESPARAAVSERLLAPETARGLLTELSGASHRCTACGRSWDFEQLERLPGLTCGSCAAPLRFEPADPGSGVGPGSGLGPSRPSERQSGLGPTRPSDRQSGLGPTRPSDRQSGLGPTRPSDRGPALAQTQRRRAGPTRIGGYEIERELGRGNNGVVYLAHRPGLARPFALKVMLQTAALGAEARQRFLLEAQIGSKLDHPGVVPVFDVGEADECLYFVMEYCEGESLEEVLRREGRLDPLRAAEVVHDLAEAMSDAHERAVIHRDLKPGNVLIDRRTGRARVTDFGLARDRELAATMTRSGDVLGTPFYMAPEQLQGGAVTALVDVYALGVILYQSLTGQRPYEAKTPFDLAKAILAGNAPSPRQLQPDVPLALERICLQAMAVHPGERIPSAKQLQAELAALLRGEPVAAPGGGALRRRLALLVGGGLGFLAVAGGLALVASWRSRVQEREALLARLTGPAELDLPALPGELGRLRALGAAPEELALVEGRRRAWEGLLEAERALASDDLPAARAALGAVPKGGSDELLLARRAVCEGALEAEERAERYRAECVGLPLQPALLARWEASLATAGEHAARLRRPLLSVLRDRIRLEDYLRIAAAEPAEEQPWHALTAAWLMLERGKREEARTEFARWASDSAAPPGVGAAGRGLIAMVEARDRDALLELERAVAARPDFVAAPAAAALSRHAQGQSAEAARAFEALVAQHPDSVPILLARARLRLSLRQLSGLTAEIDRCLALLGEVPTERVLLAGILIGHAAQEGPALNRYLDLVKQHFPESPVLLTAWGLTLYQTRREQDAFRLWGAVYAKAGAEGFRHAAEAFLTPEQSEQLTREVERYASQEAGFRIPLGELPARARQAFEELVGRVAAPEARQPLLEALVALGEGWPWDRAERQFDAARAAAPRDPELALTWLRAQLGRDRLAAAREALATCRELGVSARRLTLLEADLEYRRGDRVTWARLLQGLLEGGASDAEAVFARSYLLLDKDRGDRGVQEALRLLRPHLAGDRFARYLAIRAGMYASERGLIKQAILHQFQEEGLIDSATLTFYGLEQSIRLVRGQGERSLFAHSVAVAERVFSLTEGAWPHLAYANVTMATGLRNEWVKNWLVDRLDAAERLEPQRGHVFLLRGVFAYMYRGALDELRPLWQRARELGVEPRELADWLRVMPQLAQEDLGDLIR